MADPEMMPIAWTTAALDALAPSAAASPFGGLASAGEICSGAQLYEYTHGRQHALVAVKLLALSGGKRLDVVALRSNGDRLDVGAFDADVERLARQQGAQLIAMCTQVPHVAKSCSKHGWGITGAIMQKVIK